MSANQDFILKLLTLLVPLLTLVVTGVIAWMQLRARYELEKLARSVDGMKDELVTSARAEGVAKGGKAEADIGAARAVEVATAERLNPEVKP